MTRATLTAAVVAVTTSAAAGQVFRARVDLVHFSVAVTDKKGAPLTGLTAEDFEIVEDGTPQTITYFAEGDPEDGDALGEVLPLHLGLALDTSGSMERDIHDVRTAVIRFLNANEAAIDITLVDFDTEVRLASYNTADIPRLIERIRMRKPEGWTAFYDALALYLNGAVAQNGQKILLVYTDGADTRSSMGYQDLLDLLKASDVTMYVIGYLEQHPSSVRNEQRMRLHRMAALTGGQAFFPSSTKDLDRIYDAIQREIAARYSLGYVSTDARMNGVWRRVDIRLKRPDLARARLRTRSGYFAPFREGGGR